MSYCPYCGREVTADMRFCPSCGAALGTETKTYETNALITSETGDYKIYITGLGSSTKSETADLLEDVLGYSSVTASNLVSNIPVLIAENLSLKQAAVVAQAFEEYGLQLSVTNKDEYEDISSHTSASSIFNSDGSFLASAALVLATIGSVNRLRRIVTPKKPSLLEKLFHSLFNVRKKPVHVRRTIRPRMNTPYNEPPRRMPAVRQQLRAPHERSDHRGPERSGPGHQPQGGGRKPR